MKPRIIVLAAVACCWLGPLAEANQRDVDPRLVTALRQAVADPAGFPTELDGLVWLADMSQRLQRRIRNPFYRVDLLKIVYAEATRAGLEPELVLALIDVESSFDRFAVSPSGARGLMQIMPFWKKEIGHPQDDLFHPQINLRYGCTILRHYLDRSDGELWQALVRYNGSAIRYAYARKVLAKRQSVWRPQTLTASN